MYVPSLISIPFVLSKIWPGQTSIMKKWLWGDNSVNIQGRIIDFGFCPSPHCHLSIKCHLNANRSYLPDNVLDGGRTDRQWGDYMLPPLGSIIKDSIESPRTQYLHVLRNIVMHLLALRF